MKQHEIVLIPGDGIGPEVTEACKRVLKAAGATIDWIERRPEPGSRMSRGRDGEQEIGPLARAARAATTR